MVGLGARSGRRPSVSQPQRTTFSEIAEEEILAALHVRGHVQAVRAAGVPSLRPSLEKLLFAGAVMKASTLGEDPDELYQRLLEVLVAAENVATRLLVANPDLKPRHRA
jgi:hypothetical protein